ncbi:MAG: putative DNA binding domain-containing protein [Oscillospiraceae bacterium]|nr:putative DNA binding domain-containing protein [Oscillospiraceae bacterium]
MAFEFLEERNRIEYKSQVPDDFEEAVVAFLNYAEGGDIYVGIDDKTKTIVGVENLDLVQRQIADRIKNNIQPHTLGLFDILVEKIDGVEVIKVVVTSGIEKPYYLRKKGMSPAGCFIRVGSSNQHLTTEQIDAIYAKRIPLRLSNMRSPRQTLTFKQLEIYYSEQKLTLNEEFLRSLDLLNDDGSYNYAAYLLADENGVSIKVAKYAGTTKVDLIENEEYGYRCLITATNRVLEKLRVENKTFAKVTAQRRLERQMVDELALKEALINAIVHNDYSLEVPPVVEIFSDRLTITSYGGLPQGLSRENFFRCRSMPRNRELMRIFKDLDLVEQLGSGMSRIMEAYDQSIFTFEDNFLIVTFPFADGYENQLGTTMQDTDQDADQVSDQDADQVSDQDVFADILDYCEQARTKKEICTQLGYKNLTYFTRKYLNPLVDDGKLSLTIPEKPTSRNQRYVASAIKKGG